MKRPPWHIRRQRLLKVAERFGVSVRWWWPNTLIRAVLVARIVGGARDKQAYEDEGTSTRSP